MKTPVAYMIRSQSMADRPLSRVNEEGHKEWEKLTGKQGNVEQLNWYPNLRDPIGN